MKVALYARVSTSKPQPLKGETGGTGGIGEPAWKQNPEVQLEPLRRLAQAREWEPVEYTDRCSGAKESRPGLDRLMADARHGKFSVVVVWKFDRFARSTRHLLMALEEFRGLKVDFISHTEAVDTTTPMGRAMFTILGAFAELEREYIRERVKAGIDKRRRAGKHVGRKPVEVDRDGMRSLLAGRASISQVARALGMRRSTAAKYLRQIKQEDAAA